MNIRRKLDPMYLTDNATDFIGQTPILKLNRLQKIIEANVYAKMELFNPTSIKDRAVLNMIKAAMTDGKIISGTEVVEASSGNTAIAIASLGVVLGYRTKIFMSDLCSEERIKILSAYGAKVILTPGIEHTKGSRKRAIKYCEENLGKTFFLNQHDNIENGNAHITTTGPEIWEQMKGNIDAVVIGLGTSGTLEGISAYMKNKNKDIKIIAYEPESSPVYSGGKQGKHKIIGIGPGFVTENFIRSKDNLDEIFLINDKIAFEWVQLIAQKEGILVGPSSAAGAWLAFQLAKRPEYKGKNIVCFFYDPGERYLSTEGLFNSDNVEVMS
jgi:cysteine synthase